jgi:hypothetical protein
MPTRVAGRLTHGHEHDRPLCLIRTNAAIGPGISRLPSLRRRDVITIKSMFTVRATSAMACSGTASETDLTTA